MDRDKYIRVHVLKKKCWLNSVLIHFFQLFLDIWFGYCEIADVLSVQCQPGHCLHFFLAWVVNKYCKCGLIIVDIYGVMQVSALF